MPTVFRRSEERAGRFAPITAMSGAQRPARHIHCIQSARRQRRQRQRSIGYGTQTVELFTVLQQAKYSRLLSYGYTVNSIKRLLFPSAEHSAVQRIARNLNKEDHYFKDQFSDIVVTVYFQ